MENKEKCRKLVAKLSVVPQRPSRLRDTDDNEMRKREGGWFHAQSTVVREFMVIGLKVKIIQSASFTTFHVILF